MRADDHGWRRNLARALTRQARATVQDIIAAPPALGGASHRIGITGPPGAGKSSLIAMLAQQRLDRGRGVGVLAIDPTSPVSGGSLLGDRVRMDAVAENPALFIRSIPSGSYVDGLCPNILGLLDAFDQGGFDDVILETVGVGQINYAGRNLVETFILVMAPESGDTVQAMKAGILETADIYVVNKADLPAAKKLASELRSVARWRSGSAAWTPPIVLASTPNGLGGPELDAAIDRHRAATFSRERADQLMQARHDYQLRSLLTQRLDEILESTDGKWREQSLGQAYEMICTLVASGPYP